MTAKTKKTFKELRLEASDPKKTRSVADPEEVKLDDLPSDESQLDDADENTRNPDGSAESQVDKSIKPIYVKDKNGVYTLNKESVDEGIVGAVKRTVRNVQNKRDQKTVDNVDRVRKIKRRNVKRNDNAAARQDKGDYTPIRQRKLSPKDREYADPEAQSNANDLRLKIRARKIANIRSKRTNEDVQHDLAMMENVIDDLKKASTLAQPATVTMTDGSTVKVDPISADAILKAHGALNINNQNKMAKRLSTSSSEFKKMQKFALKQTKLSGRIKAIASL